MKKDLIVNDKPKSPISESIRLLRTNLSYVTSDLDSKAFLVTSCAPSEGKSWVSSNLSIAFAQAGQRVLLVDSDLRKGRQNEIFDIESSKGFSDYLKEIDSLKLDNKKHEKELSEIIVATKIPNLWVITSGSFVINPVELLSSDSIEIFLKIMNKYFDVIIFDGAPVSIVADSLELCKKVDYVVFVVAAEQTKKDIILNSKKSIEKVGGKIAGVVLNRVPQVRVKEYSKYYSKYDESYKAEEYKKSSDKDIESNLRIDFNEEFIKNINSNAPEKKAKVSVKKDIEDLKEENKKSEGKTTKARSSSKSTKARSTTKTKKA